MGGHQCDGERICSVYYHQGSRFLEFYGLWLVHKALLSMHNLRCKRGYTVAGQNMHFCIWEYLTHRPVHVKSLNNRALTADGFMKMASLYVCNLSSWNPSDAGTSRVSVVQQVEYHTVTWIPWRMLWPSRYKGRYSPGRLAHVSCLLPVGLLVVDDQEDLGVAGDSGAVRRLG